MENDIVNSKMIPVTRTAEVGYLVGRYLIKENQSLEKSREDCLRNWLNSKKKDK